MASIVLDTWSRRSIVTSLRLPDSVMSSYRGTPDPYADRSKARRASPRPPIPRFKPEPLPETPDRIPDRTPDLAAKSRPLPKPPVQSAAPKLPPVPLQKPAVKPPSRYSFTAPAAVSLSDAATPAQSAAPSAPRPLPVRMLKGALRLHWLKNWALWWTIAAVGTTGLGVLSAAILLKLPALPNCPAIFWPTASASLRLYCAELAANKRTTDDLLEAIALVNQLPEEHPLRPEINRLIEAWSLDILQLGDETFNRGDLNQAIAIARRIPAETPAHELVEERIQKWQAIWAEGEKIFEEAKAALRKEDFRGAFTIANRLLLVDNTHWQTTKYDDLNDLITVARRDGGKLAEARNLASSGTVEAILEAMALIKEVNSQSVLYEEAQKLLKEMGRDMIALAQNALDRGDYAEAIAIIGQIPEDLQLESESEDFLTLARAQNAAWRGSIPDLEEAILQAKRIKSDRPLYSRAQQLISQWQVEIQDVTRLGAAQNLAQSGTVSDLRSAIAEAQTIPSGNPKWDDAQGLIGDWASQIEVIEDSPYLDRAEQLAAGGDAVSLQAAINEASQIGSGRALYGKAQDRIATWVDQLQRMQDQPLLDRARQLAQQGDLASAIVTAEQIQSGRVLYDEAQSEVQSWRSESDGYLRMQQAQQLASSGTPSALVSAIRAAEQVPEGSSSRSEANQMIEAWSSDLMSAAQLQARSDLRAAIGIAELIPSYSSRYSEAQQQIQAWRDLLSPPRLQTVPSETFPQ